MGVSGALREKDRKQESKSKIKMGAVKATIS